MSFQQRGYNVVVLSRDGHFINSQAFDSHASSTADDLLATFLTGLPNNVIVLAATQDEAWWTGGASESNKQAADAQLTNFGATNPRPLGYRATWALVGYRGSDDKADWKRFAEALRGQGPTEIFVTIPNGCA